jgi:hypothetical protein
MHYASVMSTITLKNARAVRESMGVYLTQRELKAMKEEGRS